MPDRSRIWDDDLAKLLAEGEPRTQAPGDASGDAANKNPAAVALGRLGGLKGGHARAKALSKQRRVAIARKAARARWNAKKRDDIGDA